MASDMVFHNSYTFNQLAPKYNIIYQLINMSCVKLYNK